MGGQADPPHSDEAKEGRGAFPPRPRGQHLICPHAAAGTEIISFSCPLGTALSWSVGRMSLEVAKLQRASAGTTNPAPVYRGVGRRAVALSGPLVYDGGDTCPHGRGGGRRRLPRAWPVSDYMIPHYGGTSGGLQLGASRQMNAVRTPQPLEAHQLRRRGNAVLTAMRLPT